MGKVIGRQILTMLEHGEGLDTIDPATSLATIDQGAIASWSDEKRADFVSLYQARTNVARYLLHRTAEIFMGKCLGHRFISDRHANPINKKYNFLAAWQTDKTNWQLRHNSEQWLDIGGRDVHELEEIAKERATALYKELPPLKKAVEIIDAPTSLLIAKVDKLKKKAQDAADALEDNPSEISMADYPDMVIRDFLAQVKAAAKQRRKWADTIHDCGNEARDLEARIAKKLYAGLPGLSDAVVSVIHEHMEKAVALDQLTRRVGESVKFGDSEAAMELLRGFETDEATVSEEMSDKIKGAMEVLKGKVKALSKKKKKKSAAKRKAKALAAKKGAK